jgi:hypothetical protein
LQLYQIYPVLIAIPTILIAAIMHFFVESSKSSSKIQLAKMLQVKDENDHDKKRKRRQSQRQRAQNNDRVKVDLGKNSTQKGHAVEEGSDDSARSKHKPDKGKQGENNSSNESKSLSEEDNEQGGEYFTGLQDSDSENEADQTNRDTESHVKKALSISVSSSSSSESSDDDMYVDLLQQKQIKHGAHVDRKQSLQQGLNILANIHQELFVEESPRDSETTNVESRQRESRRSAVDVISSVMSTILQRGSSVSLANSITSQTEVQGVQQIKNREVMRKSAVDVMTSVMSNVLKPIIPSADSQNVLVSNEQETSRELAELEGRKLVESRKSAAHVMSAVISTVLQSTTRSLSPTLLTVPTTVAVQESVPVIAPKEVIDTDRDATTEQDSVKALADIVSVSLSITGDERDVRTYGNIEITGQSSFDKVMEAGKKMEEEVEIAIEEDVIEEKIEVESDIAMETEQEIEVFTKDGTNVNDENCHQTAAEDAALDNVRCHDIGKGEKEDEIFIASPTK